MSTLCSYSLFQSDTNGLHEGLRRIDYFGLTLFVTIDVGTFSPSFCILICEGIVKRKFNTAHVRAPVSANKEAFLSSQKICHDILSQTIFF